jgi:hypothetical protein
MYVLRHCSFVQTPYMADVEPSAWRRYGNVEQGNYIQAS